MTINEAAKKWKVREKTVWNYIEKGYIYDLSLKNNEIILPDIPKPHTKHNAKNDESCYRAIIKACNEGLYLNANILKICKEKFITYIKVLELNKYIRKVDESITNTDSTSNFISTLDGINAAKKRKFIFNININIKNNASLIHLG